MGCGFSTNTNVIETTASGQVSPNNNTTRDPQSVAIEQEEIPPTITVTTPSYTPSSYCTESVTVIVVHFNPSNYKRRSILVNECIQRLVETQLRISENASNTIGLDISVVELCYGTADVQINSNTFPTIKTICCRCDSKHKMWSKEQLINIAIDEKHINPITKYVVWIDSDIAFTNDNWVSDVVSCLSKNPLAFGQVWNECQMLGPKENNYNPVTIVQSFASQYNAGKEYKNRTNSDKDYWHPGFAWMATIDALRLTKGLLAKTLGSADRHMAMSFIGSVMDTVPDGLSESYLDQILTWQEYIIDNKIQLVHIPGLIQHHWHGPMHRRKYMERFDILKKHQYNPTLHLQYNDYTGLYLWSDNCPIGLIKDVEQYFNHRQEDSTKITESTNTDDDWNTIINNTTNAVINNANSNASTQPTTTSKAETTSSSTATDDAGAAHRNAAAAAAAANDVATNNAILLNTIASLQDDDNNPAPDDEAAAIAAAVSQATAATNTAESGTTTTTTTTTDPLTGYAT